MLAAALGGEVTQAPQPEIGWIEIDSDIPDLIAPGPWMAWHIDRFTVPEGAIELARTPLASQAFRVGRSLGVQFHPEVDAAIVKRWAADGDEELRAHHMRATDVIADSERHEQRARADAYRLCDGFWTTIATS
jgi:GMP synthase-like glutamine amidotransferase